jgi:mono/diheme cytochrome c family protein
MNCWRLASFLLLLSLAKCAGLPHPSPVDLARAQQRYPKATLDSLESGRLTYAQRCSGCHALRAPQNYRPEEWERHVENMAKEAGLNSGEKELVAEFLVTMSAVSEPKGGSPR